MSYETGSATDVSDLMAKLITFATTYCGFTDESAFNRTENLNYAGAAGATAYTIRCISRGGVYWWFRYTSSNIFCLLATGTGATWATIANRAPHDSEVYPLTGSFTLYRFFEVDDSLHVALKRLNSGASSWVHFSLGKIQKYGSWTGGEYFAPSYQEVSAAGYYSVKNSQYHTRLFGNKGDVTTAGSGADPTTRANYGVIRCTYNSKDYADIDQAYAAPATGLNCVVTRGGARNAGAQADQNYAHDEDYTPAAWSDTAAATPVEFMLLDDIGAGRFFDLGYLTGIRFLNIKNLTDDALINTDWRAYPCSYRGETGSSGYAASGDYGIAFREV